MRRLRQNLQVGKVFCFSRKFKKTSRSCQCTSQRIRPPRRSTAQGSSAAPPAQPAAFSEIVSTARLDNLRKAEAPAKPKMVDLLDLDFSPKKSAPSFEADFGDFGDFVSQAPAPKINAPSNPFDLMNSPVNKGKSSNPFAFSGL